MLERLLQLNAWSSLMDIGIRAIVHIMLVGEPADRLDVEMASIQTLLVTVGSSDRVTLALADITVRGDIGEEGHPFTVSMSTLWQGVGEILQDQNVGAVGSAEAAEACLDSASVIKIMDSVVDLSPGMPSFTIRAQLKRKYDVRQL